MTADWPAATVPVSSDDPAVVSLDSASQVPFTSFSGGAHWTVFPIVCSGDGGTCFAVNQDNPSPIAPVPVDAFSGVVATIDATAGSPGVALITASTVNGSFNTYFGLAGVDPVSITVVPEPGTASLLALGVCLLALARIRLRVRLRR